MSVIPRAPDPDTEMAGANLNEVVLAFLNTRRSCPAPALRDPGPGRDDVRALLRLAARIPDHRRLAPWRFVVFEGAAREAAGVAIAARYRALHPDAAAQTVAREKRRFLRAPVVIGVFSSPDHTHKTPVWEQELSAGAVCFQLLLAANAAGWAGVWLTEWLAFDPVVCAAFGQKPGERIAGFIYLGTGGNVIKERPRPAMDGHIRFWSRPDTA